MSPLYLANIRKEKQAPVAKVTMWLKPGVYLASQQCNIREKEA